MRLSDRQWRCSHWVPDAAVFAAADTLDAQLLSICCMTNQSSRQQLQVAGGLYWMFGGRWMERLNVLTTEDELTTHTPAVIFSRTSKIALKMTSLSLLEITDKETRTIAVENWTPAHCMSRINQFLCELLTVLKRFPQITVLVKGFIDYRSSSGL